jgi:glutaredoxin
MITDKLTLITSNNCIHCKNVKKIFLIKGIDYVECNVDTIDAETIEWIRTNTSTREIPQLFLNSKFIASGQLNIMEQINNNFT